MNQRRAGVILSYLSDGVKAISVLLYTPIMLRLLGKSEYGLYQLVASVVSYLGLLSLGLSGAYLRYYARYKARSEETEIARLNGMFMTIFSLMAALCILCGAVMTFYARTVFGDNLTPAEISKARVLLMLMAFNLAVTFPSGVFESYASAHERFAFLKAVTFLQNLLNPFITIPLLLMGYGSVSMAVVTTVLTLGAFAANMWYCISRLHIRFLFRGFRLSLLREMGAFTFFIFLNQVIDRMNNGVDQFLLGRMIGTAAVANYSVGEQIYLLFAAASVPISGVFYPKVNELVAKGRGDEELTDLFILVGRVQFIVLTLILSGVIFFGRQFIRIWTGEGFEDSYYVALLLLVPAAVPLIQNLGLEIQRAKNKHKVRSVTYFFIAVANVIMSIPLIKGFGPVGAAAGTSIAILIGNCFFMNWYYNIYIGIGIARFWKSVAGFVPALLIPGAVGIFIMLRFETMGLGLLITLAAVYTAVYFASMWFFGMNSAEKQMVTEMLSSVKKR